MCFQHFTLVKLNAPLVISEMSTELRIHLKLMQSTYLDVQALCQLANSHDSYINSGAGSDFFYVLHKVPVSINASANDNQFYISSFITSSSLSDHLQNAQLNVIGGGAFDHLNVSGTPVFNTH